MPTTKSITIGGDIEAKEATMASGKIVRDVLGFRKSITASWEWFPMELMQQVVNIARAGEFVTLEYPDPTGKVHIGRFTISIGEQKIFKFVKGKPLWFNVELNAVAQELEKH